MLPSCWWLACADVVVVHPPFRWQRSYAQGFVDGIRRLERTTGIVFDGIAEAMRVPHSDIRLFGKPESFTKRRMGVALVFDADVEVARTQAKLAASLVKPRTA